MKTFFIAVCIIGSFTGSAASAGESIENFLQAFHSDPAKMMQRLPSLVNKNGEAIPQGFINEDRGSSDRFIEQSNDLYENLFRDALEDPEPNDDAGPSNGVDSADRIVEPGPILTNIVEMQQRGLTSIVSPSVPWADSYWPVYKGVLGNRYSEAGFPNSLDWMQTYNYVMQNPASGIVLSGNLNRINSLSPAEKYDFVMGDMSFSLTNYSWSMGKRYHDKYGFVPKWVGICHGWSGAAHMNAAVPGGPVTVLATNGTPVKFYQQDVKALQSMLWAKGAPRARIAGSRCNVVKPQRNANGRIIDPKCFDVSPHTWHVAIVNQLGLHRRTIVMDNTYDHEVWNFPILSFKYRYFNPQTWRQAKSATTATIPIERFTVDKFSEFRSPDARYVVGIFMDVTYVVETTPSTRIADPEPPTKTARYIYDLELNGNMEVIGGEWYSNAHPDFIWTFPAGSQAGSVEDNELAQDRWTIDQPVPASWTDPARRAGSRGKPLFSFIRRLVPAIMPDGIFLP